MTFPHCDVRDLDSLLWLHVAVMTLCGIVVLASFAAQTASAAPYGRHVPKKDAGAGWGCEVPQRLGHFLSDALPGVPLFLAVYLAYAGELPQPQRAAYSEVGPTNIVLVIGWLLHYVHRGWIHPWIMRYSSPKVALGIVLGGTFPNVMFSYLIAAQLGCTTYPVDWPRDPRFIIGVILYVVGYITNRWADLHLRGLRQQHAAKDEKTRPLYNSGADAAAADGVVAAAAGKDSSSGVAAVDEVKSKYFIPHGGLFELVSCPNYFGELVEWCGFALAAWSWPALIWAAFGASTFIPRSLTHHRWYHQHFGSEYPAKRRALVPYIL